MGSFHRPAAAVPTFAKYCAVAQYTAEVVDLALVLGRVDSRRAGSAPTLGSVSALESASLGDWLGIDCIVLGNC